MDHPAYVTRELTLDGLLQAGSRGAGVRRAQEWLCLHGHATAVDGDFGPATARAVAAFQTAKQLGVTGKVNGLTWKALVAPMAAALQPVAAGAGARLPETLLKVARQHLAQSPREVGGDNAGPWVRLYMRGNDGPAWYWCAGFVTFLLRQSCEALGVPMPIAGSDSCDSLAYQARERKRFVAGRDLAGGRTTWGELGAAQIFLVRKTATDWTHCGLSFAGDGDSFRTIEGNTNDDGSRNGYEACGRTRSVANKDFVRLV